MLLAYYNEIDPYAAQWLRNLIAAGHIAPGDVDERSILDVRPDELTDYTQCHFFAGVGGWSLALRLSDWPDDRPVWTGSCPCQPFSSAGKGEAGNDERHLWPAWLPLIAERRPPVVFGEQVEAAVGWGWVDAVFSDLEAEGYACGTAVLPACGVGAPHIRQRLWFVANASGERCEGQPIRLRTRGSQQASSEAPWSGANGGLAIANISNIGRNNREQKGQECQTSGDKSFDQPNEGRWRADTTDGGDIGPVGNASGNEQREPWITEASDRRAGAAGGSGAWRDLTWLPCTDGKARAVEPGTFPLAHGIPGRVGRLRAYGNAIVPQVAAEFIRATGVAA